MLDGAVKSGVKPNHEKFLSFFGGAVYGASHQETIPEDHPEPVSSYGITKHWVFENTFICINMNMG